MSYSGSYAHTVDPKGRVVVPATFRDLFRDGGQLLLRRDHVALYDAAGWDAFLVKLRDLRDRGDIGRPAFNQLMSLASPVSPDTQGRFLLPPRLRQKVGIEGDAIFVGADDYLGIYSPASAPLPEGDDFESLMDTVDGLPL